ncbi:MAG: hypothetical protein ABSH19_09125, partial [Opitutales bacterium]
PALLAWLNALPAVQAVLAALFDGRPVTPQNLSQWRLGGYADWLRAQEARAWLTHLREEAARLRDDSGPSPVSGWLAGPLAIALGRCLETVASRARDNTAHRHALIDLASALNRLRRCDHAEDRLRIKNERWRAQQLHDEFAAKEKLVEAQERLVAAKAKAEEDKRHADRVALMRANFYNRCSPSSSSAAAPSAATVASAALAALSAAYPSNPSTPPADPASLTSLNPVIPPSDDPSQSNPIQPSSFPPDPVTPTPSSFT